ncbi:MAG TPA: helix-turn-helix transcriptional regulator [Candidatus Avirikenella pullistercoris]|nr:helix-turn-helix transcriptional regulator [Candidatus Avirikenella pullistercoris]
MCQFGEKIKQLRKQAELSEAELAQKSMLTQEQLTAIEDNTLIPSISILIKICRALNVSVSVLLDGTESEPISITRKQDRQESISFSNGQATGGSPTHHNMNFFSLAPTKTNRTMEPFVIEVRKDDDPADNFSSHEGEEFVYVAEGEIELTYGDKKNILKTGDSVYYDSIVPHQINSLTEVSKLVAVMYMPW